MPSRYTMSTSQTRLILIKQGIDGNVAAGPLPRSYAFDRGCLLTCSVPPPFGHGLVVARSVATTLSHHRLEVALPFGLRAIIQQRCTVHVGRCY